MQLDKGKYRLIRRIAVGGMAELFLATVQGEAGFQRPVIIKKILPTYADDPEFARRLINEGLLASHLQHANIVQVMDLGKLGSDYFIAMEFIDGPDLREVLGRSRSMNFRLPIPIAVHLLWQTARALAYAHDKKDRKGEEYHIVHRDISPANVLLSWEGAVKLGDFGIAKARYRMVTTLTGVLQGKFPYMSPEQGEGEEQDQRSDIFSFGTVAYELLAGVRPFDADTDLKTLEQIRQVRFLPLHRVRPDLPQELVDVVHTCLRKKREERYDNGDQLERALARILQINVWSVNDGDVADMLTLLYGEDKRSLADGIGDIPDDRVQILDAHPIDPTDVAEFGTNPPTFPFREDAASPRTRSVVMGQLYRPRTGPILWAIWVGLMLGVAVLLGLDFAVFHVILNREPASMARQGTLADIFPEPTPNSGNLLPAPGDLSPQPTQDVISTPEDLTLSVQDVSTPELRADSTPAPATSSDLLEQKNLDALPGPRDSQPESSMGNDVSASDKQDASPTSTTQETTETARETVTLLTVIPPDARIYREGTTLGEGSARLVLSPRTKTNIRLEHPNFEPVEFVLEWPAPSKLRKQLEARPQGQLKLRYFPASADVTIDGRPFVGENGLNIIEARLPVGEHVVEVRSGDQVETQTITITRDALWRGTITVSP